MTQSVGSAWSAVREWLGCSPTRRSLWCTTSSGCSGKRLPFCGEFEFAPTPVQAEFVRQTGGLKRKGDEGSRPRTIPISG